MTLKENQGLNLMFAATGTIIAIASLLTKNEDQFFLGLGILINGWFSYFASKAITPSSTQ